MMKTLDFNEKQKTSYCIPLTLRDEQIKINLRKVKARIEPVSELRKEPIAIVCFAPSLNDTWKQIKKFKYVMTCSGAHKFLIDRGIVPTYHLDLDPRAHKIKILGKPHKDVEYLIASTIHPKYLDALEGYNVKLWHIFATEEEGVRVLPRGEWALTGGSSVGLRCLTIARFLGFTDFHIFGMDGSMTEGKTHSHEHPNAPKEKFTVEYNGKMFLTTPSMLHVAKETFSELDVMADVTAKFYGEGLVQEMAKNYKKNPKHNSLIAFNEPELISKEFIELNKKLHEDEPTYGMGGAKHKDTVLQLSKDLKTTDILDYGAGKMMLQKSLPFPIFSYDPAIPEISQPPRPSDIVICTDVLEHIEPDKLKWVLEDLKRCVKQIGYFVISTRTAEKTYANKQNAHLIVQGKDWWTKKLSRYFEIGTTIEKEYELHFVVAPKKIMQAETTVVEKDGMKMQFLTPNDTTKWRAKTLFTKEPSTIAWIESMKAGDVMYDIGANIGSYTIFAAARGIKVYAFEPEADNYALLVKNMALNGIEPTAYCMAITDQEKAGILYAGQKEAGGAQHAFDESVNFDLTKREKSFHQGCFGITLDMITKRGLPSPQHIKIDVDGFEHKVISGALINLKNGVQSVLVEVNPNLPQHKEMIELLKQHGFEYDEQQVISAARKEGAFKGCAEYIFRKKESHPIANWIIQRIRKAKINEHPFPHIYIDSIFPPDTYYQLMSTLYYEQTDGGVEWVEIEKSRGTRGYPLRFTGTPQNKYPVWKQVYQELLSGELKKILCQKLGVSDADQYKDDLLLIHDREGYKISPHTDIPKKVISALFYLPENPIHADAGTNIYKPKEKGFISKTGEHLDFGLFKRFKTMPFAPNTLFAFLRTDNSFHGVEPSDCIRNVLLYNINRQ